MLPAELSGRCLRRLAPFGGRRKAEAEIFSQSRDMVQGLRFRGRGLGFKVSGFGDLGLGV